MSSGNLQLTSVCLLIRNCLQLKRQSLSNGFCVGLAGYVDNGRLFVVGRVADMLFASTAAIHATELDADLNANLPPGRRCALALPPAPTQRFGADLPAALPPLTAAAAASTRRGMTVLADAQQSGGEVVGRKESVLAKLTRRLSSSSLLPAVRRDTAQRLARSACSESTRRDSQTGYPHRVSISVPGSLPPGKMDAAQPGAAAPHRPQEPAPAQKAVLLVQRNGFCSSDGKRQAVGRSQQSWSSKVLPCMRQPVVGEDFHSLDQDDGLAKQLAMLKLVCCSTSVGSPALRTSNNVRLLSGNCNCVGTGVAHAALL